MPARWRALATLGLGMLWAYGLVVLLLEDPVGPAFLAVLVAAGVFGIDRLLAWSLRRRLLSVSRLANVTAGSFALLLSLLAADVGYSVYLNASSHGEDDPFQDFYRATDRQAWHFEHFPRQYYPTERNFRLFKPGVRIDGEVYGHAYYAGLMDSPTVATRILERRRIRYAIDEHGLRDGGSPERATIFALGDSFVFGTGISQEKTWVERLERATGESIYNLGIPPSSPRQQLMLLQYLLETRPQSFPVRRLLWMVFEGNDLDDSYEQSRPVRPAREESARRFVRGTIADFAISFPRTLKRQALIHRWRSGQIRGTSRGGSADAHVLDGVVLRYPVYHSRRYGYRLFQQPYIDASRRSRSEVFDHPNRPLLEATFREMASLSREHGFAVTVLIAPSAPRLYASHFDDFPPASEDRHFARLVAELAKEAGFRVVDLYPPLRAHADEELIHWRDDSHWNERGHEIVAGIVREHL